MALSKYNKDRPFLVVDLVRIPPKGSPTHKKNYGTTGEWQIGESITIEDCVKNRHMTNAAVIIDILKSKIVKNRLEKDDKEVLNYLVTKYKREITEGIQAWMHKKGMQITPRQIEKIERNIDKPGIVALALEESDNENIADKISGTTVEEFIEEKEASKKKKEAKKKESTSEEKPKRTRKKKTESEE